MFIVMSNKMNSNAKAKALKREVCTSRYMEEDEYCTRLGKKA